MTDADQIPWPDLPFNRTQPMAVKPISWRTVGLIACAAIVPVALAGIAFLFVTWSY